LSSGKTTELYYHQRLLNALTTVIPRQGCSTHICGTHKWDQNMICISAVCYITSAQSSFTMTMHCQNN